MICVKISSLTHSVLIYVEFTLGSLIFVAESAVYVFLTISTAFLCDRKLLQLNYVTLKKYSLNGGLFEFHTTFNFQLIKWQVENK